MDTQTPNPQMPPQEPMTTLVPPPSKTESKVGPIVGIIVVIIVLIVGALYFWGEQLSKEKQAAYDTTNQAMQETADVAVTQLKTQSSSDSVSSIQNDLQSTQVGNLDADFQAATQ